VANVASPPSPWNRSERYVLWWLGQGLWTCVVAWLAFQLQQEGIAPAILFPLAVGGLLAVGVVLLRRSLDIPTLRTALLTAGLWGLLAVVGQDYIGHRYRLRHYEDQVQGQQPLVAAFLAESDRPRFGEFLASRLSTHPIWWGLDVVLTAAACAAVTVWGDRRQRTVPRALQ